MPDRALSLAIKFLQISLSVVFLWFGFLKLFGVSPVGEIIAKAYPFIAANRYLFLSLALLEIALGIGIAVPRLTKISAWVMAAHLLVATFGVLFSSQAFTGGFPVLNMAGEFVIKNFVLIAGAMVVANYQNIQKQQ